MWNTVGLFIIFENSGFKLLLYDNKSVEINSLPPTKKKNNCRDKYLGWVPIHIFVLPYMNGDVI